MNDIVYRITPLDLSAHLFAVKIELMRANPRGQIISLPAWIPGSYMIRDFARHIRLLRAYSGKRELLIESLDSHCWQIQPCDQPITIEYQIYAWDLSVRAAHLDETHGFFNGTSVFLQIHEQEDWPCSVEIIAPKNKSWRVYTSLMPAKKGAKRHGFGRYQAPSYDALIDHPVEMGTPQVIQFKACGALHEMVFTGLMPNVDLKRIARDCARICEYQIKLFEPKTHKPPFLDSSDRYVFMTMVTGCDYGGLEHRASTALMASRRDLPVLGQEKMSPEYRQFLGLVSHEYFHTWNVKRIKPAAFTPYDLYDASHTTLLWVFEGFTSYYDDLVLWRSGTIDEASYQELISKIITAVLNTPGRFKQSVIQSSFNAWTKYYKQDESSPNAIISYYTKGSLIAMGLDLLIQSKTNAEKSLDDVMRELWQRYGRDFYGQNPSRGVQEHEMHEIIQTSTGVDVKKFLDRYVRGTEDVPLEKLFKYKNWTLKSTISTKVDFGCKTKTQDQSTFITSVLEGSPAHLGGLSAGDQLVAIDHIKVDDKNLNRILERYSPKDKVKVHVFRRDELRKFMIELDHVGIEYSVS